jgi:ribonuclease BN (tRNA processing enzyme)
MSNMTLLGTGTCQIEDDRRASSVLIQLETTPILFDCGHGIAQRLLEVGIRHHQIQHIILSHFHPDHISDLIPLMQAGAWSQRDPRQSDLHIYGPRGVKKLIDGLMNLFKPTSFQQPSYQIIVHEITADHFSIEGRSFDFLSLPPSGNHGLRFNWQGKVYAITGDSHFHQEEIALLKHVDVGIIDAGHISDQEIVELAIATQARRIICSHLYRDLNESQLQAQAQKGGYTGTLQIGHDLLTLPL